MDELNGSIELLVPFMAEYVSIVRLTTSGVANRVGFDIDTIEDIKVATAEVCNKLVKAGSKEAGFYRIIYRIYESKLVIAFDCEDKSLKCVFSNEEDGLGLAIMNALMDEVELCAESGYLLSITKVLEGNNVND